MIKAKYRYGFRVVGDCRQPRRLVDADAAMAACAACDERAELVRESYLSAFRFTNEFREHLTTTGSTKGFDGQCWSDWLWWDIDCDNDLERARDDARRLLTALTGRFGLADDDVLVFFSGSKGFHIGMPTSLHNPEPGRDFHRTARRFAELVATAAEVSIDVSVYDRVRCFRAPNSRHPKTGLHKRRLTADQLLHLSIDAILQLAKLPAQFDLPEPTYRSKAAAQLCAEAAEQVAREAESSAERLANGIGCEQLNRKASRCGRSPWSGRRQRGSHPRPAAQGLRCGTNRLR